MSYPSSSRQHAVQPLTAIRRGGQALANMGGRYATVATTKAVLTVI
ncbi:hypothetical protein [Nitrospirillum amazonense]|nr:hypothetical protein [Nitrospirillum amazonense]